MLVASGATPDEVDTVVLSHLHFDHTGWNTIDTDEGTVPLFPNARYVVQQAEWDYWSADKERREDANFDAVLAPIEAAGLLDLVEGEQDVTSRGGDHPDAGAHAGPRLDGGRFRWRPGLPHRRHGAPPRPGHRADLVT